MRHIYRPVSVGVHDKQSSLIIGVGIDSFSSPIGAKCSPILRSESTPISISRARKPTFIRERFADVEWRFMGFSNGMASRKFNIEPVSELSETPENARRGQGKILAIKKRG